MYKQRSMPRKHSRISQRNKDFLKEEQSACSKFLFGIRDLNRT